MASSARGRVPSPVYLHQLYRDPVPAPQQPSPGVVRQELMFFCGALKWGLLTFLAVSSFIVLMWMVFHPTYPQLNVADASMSAISINATTLSAPFNITLLLTNANRHLTTLYDSMEISLLYAPHQVLLSQFHHPQIVQPSSSRMPLVSNLSFSGVDVGSALASAIKQDLDRGSLGLEIKISAFIKYRSGKWRTRPHFMRAYCGGVSFAFTSSNRHGIFLNPYKQCEVYIYSK